MFDISILLDIYQIQEKKKKSSKISSKIRLSEKVTVKVAKWTSSQAGAL